MRDDWRESEIGRWCGERGRPCCCWALTEAATLEVLDLAFMSPPETVGALGVADGNCDNGSEFEGDAGSAAWRALIWSCCMRIICSSRFCKEVSRNTRRDRTRTSLDRTHNLRLLLVLELLMNLAEAGRAVMLRIVRHAQRGISRGHTGTA